MAGRLALILRSTDPQARVFLLLQLGLGALWLCWLPGLLDHGSAMSGPAADIRVMLLVAGWLPSIGVAYWQVRNRRWLALLLSDLVFAFGLSAVAFTLYLPLFFTMIIWFVPFSLLPRGCLARSLQIGCCSTRSLLKHGR